ncbi:MAG TPA: hypothetical protein VHE81_23120 [Lacipirellulaceae bacterium]|nr:hypothetical protein [Lacipirellulaceae bacterium]
MAHRLNLLMMLAVAGISWAAVGSLDRTQQARAQSTDQSSRHDPDSREEGRDHSHRRGGGRGRWDWRTGRSRGEGGRHGADRSDNSSSNASSTSSTSASSSSRTSTSSNSTSTATSSTSGVATRFDARSWATSLVKQNDKNGDMILEPDEQGSLGSSAKAEDLNHDGKITVDELVMYRNSGAVAANRSVGTSSPSTASSDSGRSSRHERFSRFGFGRGEGDSSGESHTTTTSDPMAGRVLTGSTGKSGDKRRSYRFTPVAERKLELPSELRSRDANGDGQVSMSEFSHYWSERMVAEFRRWDLNNDGMITAKEAAKRK